MNERTRARALMMNADEVETVRLRGTTRTRPFGSGASGGRRDPAPRKPTLLDRRLVGLIGLAVAGANPARLMIELEVLREELEDLRRRTPAAQAAEMKDGLLLAQDLVLAELQARAVQHAGGEIGVSDADRPGRDRILGYLHALGWGDEVHERAIDHRIVRASSVTDELGSVLSWSEEVEWCSAFAGWSYLEAAGLAPALAMAFGSPHTLARFLAYLPDRHNPRYLEVDGRWLDVQRYHTLRGAKRLWWDEGEIESFIVTGWRALPIRVGDLLFISDDESVEPDQVTMVQAWDPARSVLQTIQGSVRVRAEARGVIGRIDCDEELAATARPGLWRRVHGIGRLSLVDLELHRYAATVPGAGTGP